MRKRKVHYEIICQIIGLILTGFGADAGQLTETAMNQVFMAASASNDVIAVQHCLKHGASVKARAENGWTALIMAAKQGSLPLARVLVAAGADPNDRSPSEAGSTVLCFATDSKNLELMKFLLDHGAKINGRSRNGTVPLFHAVFHNDLRTVDFLLKQGCEVNLFSQRSSTGVLLTPMAQAAMNENIEMMELLLKHGAAIEMRDNVDSTLLIQLSKTPKTRVVKWLLSKGAKVNSANLRGLSPLIGASMHGQTENVKLLLAAGADPFFRLRCSDDVDDLSGAMTAEKMALENGHDDIARLLSAYVKRSPTGQIAEGGSLGK